MRCWRAGNGLHYLAYPECMQNSSASFSFRSTFNARDDFTERSVQGAHQCTTQTVTVDALPSKMITDQLIRTDTMPAHISAQMRRVPSLLLFVHSMNSFIRCRRQFPYYQNGVILSD